MPAPQPAAAAPLEQRLAALRDRIAVAARRAGRDPGEVRLVAVTKSAAPAIFPRLAAAGVRDVGESRVQQLVARASGRERDFRWHLVGHLQSNKVRAALRVADVLHGIDSIALLERVEALAAETGRRPEVFLQVNVSGEPAKHGVAPGELPALLDVASGLERARVVGLMTMAPADAPEATLRAVFSGLRRLRDAHATRWPLPGLSMGMSDDFEVAIEEGATCIRVGRVLVGEPAGEDGNGRLPGPAGRPAALDPAPPPEAR